MRSSNDAAEAVARLKGYSQEFDCTLEATLQIGAVQAVLQACAEMPGEADGWLRDVAIAKHTGLQMTEVRYSIESLDDQKLVRSYRFDDGLKAQITAEGRLFLSQRRRFPQEINNEEVDQRLDSATGPTSPAVRRRTKTTKRSRTKKDGKCCFVIAPFGQSYDECYAKVLRPAIKDAGLVPLRVDEINKPGVIVNQIWDGITSAAVCLAEVTGRNPNVMYELGIAHATGKPVIPIVQDVSDLPFDLRAIRHIVYNVNSPIWANELRRKIAAMLQQAIEDPIGSMTLPVRKTGGIRNSLETLISASETPMFLTDFDRIILYCNQSLADLVRGARADFEGKPFEEGLLPWLAKRVPERFRQRFVENQLKLQRSFDNREDPKSFAEAYFDNSDFPVINRWRGRYRVRIFAVRLPENDDSAGYFVIYDVIEVKKIPSK